MSVYITSTWNRIRASDLVVGPQSGQLFRVVTIRTPALAGTVVVSLAPHRGWQREPVSMVLERPAVEQVTQYMTDDSAAIGLLVTQLGARVLGWLDDGPNARWLAPSFVRDEVGLQLHMSALHGDHEMSLLSGAALLAEHADQHTLETWPDGSTHHEHVEPSA